MIIKISNEFLKLLKEQVHYIYKDKPRAALKFRKDLLRNIKKDLKHPFLFKKSRYFDDENIRDYVFKGYVSVYEVDVENNIVVVFGFIKYKDTL
ncbi:type II toxin-antitoxin system RelE/ParE family toxin [Flavobacterium quisquiliarum]|uniref:Type II toxin-antitoxin system RelE/ParE family toxin n=1 Tax=Flavobacterium quisquiliarum TaxID=1834436 RepID=A0ABV8W6T8_9FLAO|nr:type II toxin-antitoxin system RelE/ParE family toxin [Flavobacterium quisquiliarum]MBW1656271.1 type II toxin-antitoxin system RelE/ParE family toxin [Flavobacterium quisquiliarum]NWL02114.1 type II toxin-antitoxin system RelE/ParE family toxin [Flavobacterium collinsii]